MSRWSWFAAGFIAGMLIAGSLFEELLEAFDRDGGAR